MIHGKENKVPFPSYQEFKNLCQEHGLKVTTQRFSIYSNLRQTKAHPSAETLYETVSKTTPGLTLDTVYRTLNSLVECNLAERIPIGGGKARFDGDISSHPHFICDTCQEIHDFKWPEFEALKIPTELNQIGVNIKKIALFRGICHACL